MDKLNISKETLEKLKDLDLDSILKKVEEKTKTLHFSCRICFDKKRVHVCGGTDRSCPACSPRYK